AVPRESVATPVPRPALPPPARPAAVVTPLSPDRYKVQVTIGGDTLEKLRLAKDLLRHAVPSGDEAAILDRALNALLADLAQRKFAAAERPRPSGGTASGSRHIPADVKRVVWLRDLGRCAFVGTTGRRCIERGFLEFHHLHPHALGGRATPANIQLRCRAHNGYEARVDFGERLVPERACEGATGGRGP
ncbi:MAG TPA: HNH endonuclease, partial [Vicinamibacteria bacterium]|nr:HNH endonuclease [Vicinamibacteria bacterium]